jgi:hypothetical protein
LKANQFWIVILNLFFITLKKILKLNFEKNRCLAKIENLIKIEASKFGEIEFFKKLTSNQLFLTALIYFLRIIL